MTDEVSESGRKVNEINQVCEFFRVIGNSFLHSLWKHFELQYTNCNGYYCEMGLSKFEFERKRKRSPRMFGNSANKMCNLICVQNDRWKVSGKWDENLVVW